jgi:hypothetical protein
VRCDFAIVLFRGSLAYGFQRFERKKQVVISNPVTERNIPQDLNPTISLLHFIFYIATPEL